MKRILFLLVAILVIPIFSFSQNGKTNPSDSPVVSPSVILTPIAFEITGPLRDNPIVEDFSLQSGEVDFNKREDRILDPNITPPDFSNVPLDPNVQTKNGTIGGAKGILNNYAGQSSGSYPPDCNGTVNDTYYFQVVNTTYEIFNKATGASVAGPSDLNTIFNSSLPGANCNNGDPIVLWDEQADRWFYSEFALCNSNEYMLIAVSQTNDPTGSWYSWSFDVDDTPDYMKFGIWQDGYYMATNTGGSGKNDVYVFERSVMLAGGASPTMIGFDNPNRPSTFDGFHCILPLDNDGAWAPSGEPGQFITIADDGQSNPADQLWIFELNADWGTPSNSTFARTQTLNVNSFDGNFTGDWNNIPQSGTSQKLDGLSTILMYRAQYRNFGSTQRLVCAHAIAETSSEAALRWYELENTGSGWSIRQQSTYNPDNISRWNMSIAMNGDKEIGIGYSVSNSSMYPGIRYCGQSASANASANNTLDIAETVIQNGSYAQTAANRWGDYCNISIDPDDDHTFWFTSEYMGSSTHETRIASFQFSSPSTPPTADFTADILYPLTTLTTVNFTDNSTGSSPMTYSWSFSPSTVTYMGGTSSTSQNPSVRFDNFGAYTVTLTATNSISSDSEIKIAYIHVGTPGLWTGSTSDLWSTNTNWQNHEVPNSSVDVSIVQSGVTNWPLKNGGLNVGTDCNSLNFGSGSSSIQINGDLTISSGKTLYVDPSGGAVLTIDGNWTNNGTFTPGQSQILFNSAANATINTPTGGTTYLINDDMSGFPTDWSGDVGSGGGYFEASSTSNAGGASPESRFHWVTGTTSKQMIHDPVNTTGISTATLDFNYSVDDYSGNTYTLHVQYSTDGTTWTDLWSITPSGNVNATAVSLPLSSSDGLGTATYYIAYTITGNTYDINYWYIDDVQLHYTMPATETFYDLIIASNNATISTNGDITVLHNFRLFPKGEYTNPTGKLLNVAGNFNLETSSIMPTGIYSFLNQGSVTVGGNINYQQYLSGSAWHIVSPPFATSSLAYSGVYLYQRNEADSTYTNITSDTYPLSDERGYYAWATANSTISFTGPNTFDESNRNVSLSYTPSGYTIGTNAGYHLLGNPFASYLNWNASAAWNLTNMDATAYFWDAAAGQYKTWNGTTGTATSGWIPPTQGFYVKANNTGASLTIPSSERGHSSQGFYKAPDFPYLKVNISGNNYSDEIILSELEGSSLEFDNNFDAYHLKGIDEAPQLSISINNTEMTMNAIPKLSEDLIIPLHLSVGNENLYEIKVLEETLVDIPNIYLEDLLTNSWVNIKENSYEFSASPTDNIHRFNLRFASPTNIEDEISDFVNIYSLDQTIYIQTDSEEGEITVYDMLGQKIISKSITSKRMQIPINEKQAYYLVEVKTTNKLTTKKVFIK